MLVVAVLLPLLLVGYAFTGGWAGEDKADPHAAAATSPQRSTPPVSPSPPPATSAFDQKVAKALDTTVKVNPHLNGHLSALVVEANTGGKVWGFDAENPRMPASTRKTMTAFTVLKSLPADRQLTTRVFTDPADPASLYVQGDGDPSLDRGRIDELTRASLAAAKQNNLQVVRFYTDASALPAPVAPKPDTPPALVATDLANGWEPAYLAGQVQLPRGLTMFDYRGYEAERGTGEQFAKAFAAAGARVQYAGSRPVPQGVREIAQSRSEPIRRMVATMLSRSNNDYAEFLFRHAAIARGFRGDWQGALDNERDLLAQQGWSLEGLQAWDASGLSRANRIPPPVMAQVIRQLWLDPSLHEVAFAEKAMPLGGVSGTLRHWFRNPLNGCAASKVQAKTGNLRDVLSLAGVAQGSDNQARVFVFLDNGDANRTGVSTALETLATSAVGCRVDGIPASATATAAR